ncbi:MAG: aldo/keto reductase [Gammaproteobacteria bacterium]|nr:aldo/keto reductase [Gammaproteobacteria bacterium]MDH3467544.1 aldo/keto reductase [Gammaproteobacteria bacterium]
MHKRKVGPFEVSAIGLGCMNMSMGYGPANDTESGRLLRAALDAGYTFFDTAAMYGGGHNEELIGRNLSDRRNDFVLASKCGISKDVNGKTQMDGRPQTLKHECEMSLKRLRTDAIDLYYLHRVDPNVPVEESVAALSDLVAQGKTRAIGISEVSTATLRRAHAVHPITALQSEYSPWSRTPERQILTACQELNIAFVPFSPLGRAFFTGKAQDVSGLSDKDIRATIARPRFEPDNFAANVKLLEPYAAIAAEQGCTMAQLALAWSLAKGEQAYVPIPGTKHIEYMKENAGAGDIHLDAGVVDALDRLINEKTVAGARYTAALMASADSEKD